MNVRLLVREPVSPTCSILRHWLAYAESSRYTSPTAASDPTVIITTTAAAANMTR